MNTPVLDMFAELLSEGYGTGDAAVIMGRRREYGKALLKRLRRKMGPQAI